MAIQLIPGVGYYREGIRGVSLVPGIGYFNDPGVAATEISITGPASGAVGEESDPFYVEANGVLAGSVVVTPSDGGAGGTFVPTTVTLSAVVLSASFTYEAASSGSKLISITNNGSLTNHDDATYVAVAVPAGVITSVVVSGQTVTISGTTTEAPTTGFATLTAASPANGAITQGPTALTLGVGTFTITFTGVPTGNYSGELVELTNDGGTAEASGSVAVLILGLDGDPEAPGDVDTVPGAPTSAVATAANSSASVSFTAPGSDGGSEITGYTVTSTPGSITASGASSPIVVPGLTNGTGYTFTVHATNAIGNSAESSASSSVTPIATATLNLVNSAGIAVGVLNNLKWAWFDQATPNLFVAPTDKGAIESTDSGGVLVIPLPNSVRTTGQIGWLVVTNSDGTTGMVHKAFSGPVAVN